MGHDNGISRRRVLASIAVTSAGSALGVLGNIQPAEAAPRDPKPTKWTRSKTQNGWPVIDEKHAKRFRIEGSPANVTLVPGEVAVLLLHVARRYSYEIDTLKNGEIYGFSENTSVLAPFESNYLSGTAITIQPGHYPVGSAGNIFPPQIALIRDILLDCEGVVRWGGDDKESPKEGHFQIDVPPGSADLKRVAIKLLGWSESPGAGAGAPVDPFAKHRRPAALNLERRQQPD